MTYFKEDDIQRGKVLVEHISTSQYALGELADTIEKKLWRQYFRGVL
jgi:hypothetical protein